MRERARTVIVGGGPAAAAVAAALATGGDPDVLVLDPRAERAERDVATERFGAILQPAAAIDDVRLARDSVAAFADLARDDAAAWRAVGSLEVATTAERLAALRRRADRLAAAGVPADVLEADGAAAVLPALDAGAILGALHVPSDGVADRAAVGAAFARRAGAAGAAGAAFVAGVRVTGVRTAGGRVVAVETDAGPIACERLVLASCTASVRIAALVGIVLPVVAVPRPIRVTAAIDASAARGFDPDTMPVLRHPDAAFAIRGRGDRLALAGHGDPAAWGDAAARLLPSAADAVRALGSASDREATVTATPDGAPLVGAHVGLEGLWVLAGARLALLPALAEALAARMLGRRTDGALGGSDPNRWYPFETAPAIASARATAIVATTHAVVPTVPDELPPRHLRLSPIARRAEELRAAWTAVAGWEIPEWYATNADGAGSGDVAHREAAIAAECRAAREVVAIADRTPLAKFDLVGGTDRDDAEALVDVLRRVFPDLVDVRPGALVPLVPAATSAIADVRGIVGVAKEGSLVRIVAPAREGQRVLAALRAAVRNADAPAGRLHGVRVHERTGSLFAIALLGPVAQDVLGGVADGDVSAAAFPEGTARYLGLGPVVPVWAHRGPLSSGAPASWTLFGQVAMGEAAWDLLMDAGRGRGIVPVGAAAIARLTAEVDGAPRPSA
ncbi:MAG: FAD-dependent oxidoreductase [Actinomycetota bacterium]